jgi:hypothetical protein
VRDLRISHGSVVVVVVDDDDDDDKSLPTLGQILVPSHHGHLGNAA